MNVSSYGWKSTRNGSCVDCRRNTSGGEKRARGGAKSMGSVMRSRGDSVQGQRGILSSSRLRDLWEKRLVLRRGRRLPHLSFLSSRDTCIECPGTERKNCTARGTRSWTGSPTRPRAGVASVPAPRKKKAARNAKSRYYIVAKL